MDKSSVTHQTRLKLKLVDARVAQVIELGEAKPLMLNFIYVSCSKWISILHLQVRLNPTMLAKAPIFSFIRAFLSFVLSKSSVCREKMSLIAFVSSNPLPVRCFNFTVSSSLHFVYSDHELPHFFTKICQRTLVIVRQQTIFTTVISTGLLSA